MRLPYIQTPMLRARRRAEAQGREIRIAVGSHMVGFRHMCLFF
jgi:hypothetical protein